jgi:hypothetical protein
MGKRESLIRKMNLSLKSLQPLTPTNLETLNKNNLKSKIMRYAKSMKYRKQNS